MKKSISRERQEWDLEPDEAALEETANIASSADRERHIKDLISKGSILSMLNFAHFYEYRAAEDGGPDLVLAEVWYRKAVEMGSAVATLKAGYFYLRQKNYEKAREIFSVGRDRQYAPSILRLGDLYAKGIGVERNYDTAQELFKQAARRGNLWAKRTVAVLAARRSRDILTRLGWRMMVLMSYLEFEYVKWREPRSERLKK
jgi:TPR repeat protein